MPASHSKKLRSLETPPVCLHLQEAILFIDNANTFIGAQKTQTGDNRRIRLHLPSLDHVIYEQCAGYGFHVKQKSAFGVVKPSSKKIEQTYKNLGYTTHFQVSSTKQDTNGELKRRLQHTISGHHGEPGCIVLATGDGSSRGSSQSIPEILEGALQAGWKCLLFAWNHTLSKLFLRLSQKYQSQFRIVLLDEFRTSLMMLSLPPTPPSSSYSQPQHHSPSVHAYHQFQQTGTSSSKSSPIYQVTSHSSVSPPHHEASFPHISQPFFPSFESMHSHQGYDFMMRSDCSSSSSSKHCRSQFLPSSSLSSSRPVSESELLVDLSFL